MKNRILNECDMSVCIMSNGGYEYASVVSVYWPNARRSSVILNLLNTEHAALSLSAWPLPMFLIPYYNRILFTLFTHVNCTPTVSVSCNQKVRFPQHLALIRWTIRMKALSIFSYKKIMHFTLGLEFGDNWRYRFWAYYLWQNRS